VAGKASSLQETEWWGAGVVVCLERSADLHMAQLMPLLLTISCFRKIQIGFTFLVPAHPGSPGQKAVKRLCVCVPYFRREKRELMTADHCSAGKNSQQVLSRRSVHGGG